MAPTNYTVYSIVVYFVLNFIPHTYSTLIFSDGSTKNWDNANPKSAAVREKFQKRVSAATYLRWERARAAHNNGIENFPLLIAAVILGNMAKLNAGVMNWTFGSFLILRAVFILAYIEISDPRAGDDVSLPALSEDDGQGRYVVLREHGLNNRVPYV
ncbi:MAG: hypothetical protein Q9226_007001 [Calogaya cf. arnoldii]